uniref:Uncharacterized protein n=1 Tax=Setaria viridis TaxID=4556 RepID=A0A4U6V1M2_SETVI|nr:hypothetical protein SEVIR_4G181800v2 [Setaria viridis]
MESQCLLVNYIDIGTCMHSKLKEQRIIFCSLCLLSGTRMDFLYC